MSTHSRRYSNKVVLVTGAGSGIGRAIALGFSNEGADVVLGGRTESKLQATAKTIASLGGRVAYVAGDVGLEDVNQALVAKAVSEFGGLHVAVNNAGAVRPMLITETDKETFEWSLDANVRSVFWGTKHQLPAIGLTSTPSAQGSIINISSICATRPGLSPSAIYASSKAFMDTFTKASAKEGRTHNVRVNSISPGPVTTAGALATMGGSEEAVHAIAKKMTLRDTAGAPEEVASFVLDVVSNALINGANLLIDGGISAT
ncbi:hypothetical protein HKX48_005792 [Thoreauomyces humboldtii]|nr:hypothetical protein HKX48_005792 [Thoreauomyces humboldtii]